MNTEEGSGARYATSFKEQLFGGKCDVEVVVDLSSRRTSSLLSMNQFLSSRPAFTISLDGLRLLLRSIQDIKGYKGLLNELLPGATDHQLNCSMSGATVIVVHPPGKPARFTLSVGTFHREGALEELSVSEIEDAITKIAALEKRVLDKLPGKAVA
jgi:hypothetical protein